MRSSRAALVALAVCVAAPSFAQPAPVPGGASSHSMHHAKGDPFEGFNRRMFALNQKFDRAIFRPLARGYDRILPQPVHHGIRNFLRNLTEPIVFLNDLLQLQPRRAINTFVRFTMNSTIGIGGLIDVAGKGHLPHHNNGFGTTLGHYGVGPGPYLFLPFVGPSDLRDFGSAQIDRAILPVAVGKPFNRIWWIVPTGVIGGLEQRNASDEDLRNLLSGAADPYATLRSVYLQSRVAEIAEVNGGKKASDSFDDPLKDPEPTSPQTPPGAATPPPGADLSAEPWADAVPQTPPPPPTAATPPTNSIPASASPPPSDTQVNLLPPIY